MLPRFGERSPGKPNALDPRRSLVNNALTVDHLTYWSPLEWWLHYLGAIAIPVLTVFLVLAALEACRALVRLSLPNPVEAAVGAARCESTHCPSDMAVRTLRESYAAWPGGHCRVPALLRPQLPWRRRTPNFLYCGVHT